AAAKMFCTDSTQGGPTGYSFTSVTDYLILQPQEVFMRQFWLIALAFGSFVALSYGDDNAAKGDKEKIQGTWSVVSGKRGGKAIPEESAKNIQLVIAGDKFTIK